MTCIHESIDCSDKMPRAVKHSRWNEQRQRQLVYVGSCLSMGRMMAVIQRATVQMAPLLTVVALYIVNTTMKMILYACIEPVLAYIHHVPLHPWNLTMLNLLRLYMNNGMTLRRYQTCACFISHCIFDCFLVLWPFGECALVLIYLLRNVSFSFIFYQLIIHE